MFAGPQLFTFPSHDPIADRMKGSIVFYTSEVTDDRLMTGIREMNLGWSNVIEEGSELDITPPLFLGSRMFNIRRLIRVLEILEGG